MFQEVRADERELASNLSALRLSAQKEEQTTRALEGDSGGRVVDSYLSTPETSRSRKEGVEPVSW